MSTRRAALLTAAAVATIGCSACTGTGPAATKRAMAVSLGLEA